MSGRGGVFSPAHTPLFRGQVIRHPTRIPAPSDGYAGGSGDFPFQWSWPGTISAPADGPRIYTASGFQPARLFVTFLVAPSSPITLAIDYDGVEQLLWDVSSSGWSSLAGWIGPAPANTQIGLNVTATPGDGEGMWVGLTETT